MKAAVLECIDHTLVPSQEIPLAPVSVSCGFTGFQSPAQDYAIEWLKLDEYLGVRPEGTWFFRADGHSMQGIGILHDDILVVDATLNPQLGDICICLVEGEYLAKILDTVNGQVCLVSANKDYPPVFVEEVRVFGVVTGKVTRFRRPGGSKS